MKFGYHRYTTSADKIGWLINIHPVSSSRGGGGGGGGGGRGSLAQARLSHSGRESGQTPIPVLFRRSVLTKQQRAPLIKKCVTGRHESVEIVRAKRCLFESSRPCASYYLRAKYLMTYLLLLLILSTI